MAAAVVTGVAAEAETAAAGDSISELRVCSRRPRPGQSTFARSHLPFWRIRDFAPRQHLELDVLVPAVAAVVLKTEVSLAGQFADRHPGELVFRAVGTLAGVFHSSRFIVLTWAPLRTTTIFGPEAVIVM